MAINFPDSPNNGDSFTSNNKTWVFDGTVWNITSGTNSVADGAITTAKLASNAVHQTKLASNLSGITITTTANRDTDITSPFTGQFAFLTDTNAFIRWDGSAWVTAIVTAPTEAPTSLALVSAGYTTATISFAEGATGGSAITNYQYALSTNSGSSYGSYNALGTPDATSPITIPGLTGGTAYYIKLKAVNTQGVSAVESSALSFSTLSLTTEYLVIGGGGSGGIQVGGGGGAGGYRTNVVGATSGRGSAAEAALSLVPGTYTVTIGAGGVGGYTTATSSSSPSGNNRGVIGNNSVFSTITSLGGGGGSGYSGLTATNGGSGGGADGGGVSNFGAGTAAQGFAGGTGTSTAWAGGGGGGAGAVGGNSSASVGGVGGAGLSSSITGTAVTRGGGGGGCSDNASSSGSAGGAGGGGAGQGTSGSVNTGGGGGGVRDAQTNGSGGSGVVIIRYLTADATDLTFTVGAGLTSATTTSGSYTVRTFTAGSGNLVIS